MNSGDEESYRRISCDFTNEMLASVTPTQWTLMHLLLEKSIDQEIMLNGDTKRISEWLQSALPGAGHPLLLGFADSAEIAVTRGIFQFEYEDHHLQFRAYQLLGMAMRGENLSTDKIAPIGRSILGDWPIPSQDEPSWALMAYSMLLASSWGEEERLMMNQRATYLANSLFGSQNVPACGGAHAIVALALYRKNSTLDEEAAKRIDWVLTDFRAAIGDTIGSDGAAFLPGLHDAAPELTYSTLVYEMSHIIEVVGVLGPPFSEEESRVVRYYLRLLRDYPHKSDRTAKEFGDICHGLHGLGLIFGRV